MSFFFGKGDVCFFFMKQADKDEVLRNSVALMLSYGTAMLILSLIVGMVHNHNFGPVIYFITFLFILNIFVVVFHYKKLVLFMDVIE